MAENNKNNNVGLTEKQKEEVNQLIKHKLLSTQNLFLAAIITLVMALYPFFLAQYFSKDEIEKSEIKLKKKICKLINSEVGYSYHKSFLLSSPHDRQETMLFYAEQGHSVKIYLEISHFGPSAKRNKILIELDGEILYEPLEEFRGGFRDITEKVFSGTNKSPNREENVHSLKFSISDRELEVIKDRLFVDCLIIICGKVSNE